MYGPCQAGGRCLNGMAARTLSAQSQASFRQLQLKVAAQVCQRPLSKVRLGIIETTDACGIQSPQHGNIQHRATSQHILAGKPGNASADGKPVQFNAGSGSNEDATPWARFKGSNLTALQLRLLRHAVPTAEEATKNLRPGVVARGRSSSRSALAHRTLGSQRQGSYRGPECAGPAGQLFRWCNLDTKHKARWKRNTRDKFGQNR